MTRGDLDLSRFEAVILDFDGPMCDVFAGHPSATIAGELAAHLVDLGRADIASTYTADPMRLLTEVHRQAPAHLAAVEAHLAAAELVAVESAPETDGLGLLLQLLDEAGVPVAVASNNHGPAIERWLSLTGHAPRIRHVEGRVADDPDLMKPHPHVLLAAADALSVAPTGCCFVGDSLTDAQAATTAGMSFIAVANKAHKHQLFTDHGCATIVTSLRELIVALPPETV